MSSEHPAPATSSVTARRAALWFACLALLLRGVAALPALDGRIPNLDEVEMAWSVLDRALGVPSTTLAWPNSLLQLLALVPTLVAQVFGDVVHGGAGLVQGFVQGLAAGYRSPWLAVFVIRLVVALSASVATGIWVWALIREGMGWTAALLFVLAGVSVPLLWGTSIAAKGEGLAVALLLLAYALPRFRPGAALEDSALLAGLLAGAVLATRNVLAPAFIPLALYICGTTPRAYWVWLGGLLGGFVALCPSVWLEPLRLVKSVAGNVLRPSDGTALDGVRAVLECSPVTLWLLGLAACCCAFRRRKTTPRARREWQMAGAVVGFTLLLFLVPWLGRQLSPGYFLSVPCLLFVVTLMQAPALLALLRQRLPNPWLLAGLGIVFIGYQSVLSWRMVVVGNQRYRPLVTLRTQLLKVPQRVLMPRVLLPYFSDYVAGVGLRELSTKTAQAMVAGEGTTHFLERAGLAAAAAFGLRHNFNEDEQAFVARLGVASLREPDVSLDVSFYDDQPSPSRYGLLGSAEALARLERGEVDKLVSLGRPLPNRQPVEVIEPGADWALYVYGAAP